MWWREVAFDVMVGVQLFAVRDENTLGSDSLEMFLLLGRMVVTGGTVGGSGKNGSVMAVTMRAGVGSERRTSTGSGSGLSRGEDAVTADSRDVCMILHFVFHLVGAAFLPIVSVVFVEDRVSGGIETVEGGKTIQRMGIDGLCVGNGAERVREGRA